MLKTLSALYLDVLDRPIDDSGYQTYRKMMVEEGATIEDIRKILLESNEHKGVVQGLGVVDENLPQSISAPKVDAKENGWNLSLLQLAGGGYLCSYRFLRQSNVPVWWLDVSQDTQHCQSYLALRFLNDDFAPVSGPTIVTWTENFKNNKITGLEDGRLFFFNERIYLVANYRNESNLHRLVLMLLDQDLAIEKQWKLDLGPAYDDLSQKNWIAFQSGAELLFKVYIDSNLVVRFDPFTGRLEKTSEQYCDHLLRISDCWITGPVLRLNDMVRSVDGSYLGICHTINSTGWYHNYWFRMMGTYPYLITEFSDPFKVTRHKLEFVISLVDLGGCLLISYSVNERHNYLLEVETAYVLEKLEKLEK